MRLMIRMAGVASALLVASSAGAQDHVNITIASASLGAIPRLAGAVDIPNSQTLVPIMPSKVGGGNAGVQLYAGATDAVHATMVLPWNGAATQILRITKAYFDGQPHAVDSVICDFVHAGSNQPYLSIVLQQPVLSKLTLAYDSVGDSATAALNWTASAAEYVTPASTQAVVRATPGQVAGARQAVQLRPQMAPRIALSAGVLRSLAVIGQTGPPVDAFLQFADAGTRNIAFAPEQSLPSWTGGAMANAQAVVLTAAQPTVMIRKVDQNGVPYIAVTTRPGDPMTILVQLSKAAGSLAAAIANAQGSREPLTVTVGLADAPGHLGYRMTFNHALMASNSISSADGRTIEHISLIPEHMTVSDLRSGTTVTF